MRRFLAYILVAVLAIACIKPEVPSNDASDAQPQLMSELDGNKADGGVTAADDTDTAADPEPEPDPEPAPDPGIVLPGPANCFIVTEAGRYKFKATVIGNGEEGLHPSFPISSATISPEGAILVWEESEGMINNLLLDGEYICFNCADIDGNAVIAATDAAGTILWSWHIWRADPPKNIICDDTFILMDRNLGATSAVGKDSYGLYYQWGRKDPFSRKIGFNSADREGKFHQVVGGGSDLTNTEIHSVTYTIAHPKSFIASSTALHQDWMIGPGQDYLWGLCQGKDGSVDTPIFKSVFDPCPQGYCVVTPRCIEAGFELKLLNDDMSVSLFDEKVLVPPAGFIYYSGYGWYDASGIGFTCLWTCASAWENHHFSLQMKSDLYPAIIYDRATAEPVRCMKL